MAQYNGVTVKVVSDGKSCPMYDDPDADGHENPFSETSPPQKYIEAVAGAKFSVAVTLEPNFKFANCDGVRVTFALDGSGRKYEGDIESTNAIGGSLENRTTYFGRVRKWCPQTGQFQVGDVTFGELKLHERSDATSSLKDIKGLGQLQVCWQRILFGNETTREHHKSGKEPVSEVSEKVLKGKAIDTAIKFAPSSLFSNLQPLIGPIKYTRKEGIILPGLLGKRVRLNILYRSKRTLQMLGCIPHSPSPAPSNRTSGAVVIKPDDSKEELRLLRAQLTELENRLSNTTQPIVKSEEQRSASKIKREREDKENDGQRKKSRRSGPPEVVDLTAD
ncbi:MAG: hypothetical protein Q9226_005006 [Calogaya cf. arnoldii]